MAMEEHRMVPAREVCRWLALEAGALDRLAAGGGTAPQVEGSDVLLDPLRVQDWLHGGSQRPATGDAPSSVALLREAAVALAIRQPLEAASRRILSRLAGGLGATVAAIFLNEEGGLRRIASAGDVHAGDDGEALEGIASWVAASGASLYITMKNPMEKIMVMAVVHLLISGIFSLRSFSGVRAATRMLMENFEARNPSFMACPKVTSPRINGQAIQWCFSEGRDSGSE